MATTAYMAKMMPYAQKAESGTGIPAAVIVEQWALESGNGTSQKARVNSNHGGIKRSKYSPSAVGQDSGGFAIYSSIDGFVQDYVRVMNLSYYTKVRAAGRTGDIVATIKALGASPYDAGHYLLNGVQGGKLLNMIGSNVPAQKKTKVCPTCKRAW